MKKAKKFDPKKKKKKKKKKGILNIYAESDSHPPASESESSQTH